METLPLRREKLEKKAQKEIEVTPEMIQAGEKIMRDWAEDQPNVVSPFFDQLVVRVFLAMAQENLEKRTR